MFELLYDRRHNVLLTRLAGTYVLEDIVVWERQVARFAERNGPVRGLMDFSLITAVDVSMDTIVRRAQGTMLPGTLKVLVAQAEPGYSLCRVIAAHHCFEHKVEPAIVASLGDACCVLDVLDPDFQPVEQLPPLARESQAMRFIARLDEANRREDERLDELARQRMRQKFDTAYQAAGHPFSGGAAPSVGITVGDLVSSELRIRVDDSDLEVRCPRCLTSSRLAQCLVKVSRTTTYACLHCTETLVVVTPLAAVDTAQGYPLGGFDMETGADISCLKIVLPRSGMMADADP